MRGVLCVFVLLASSLIAEAQSSYFSTAQNELVAMFSGLDKTKVPTGKLWDQAVNLVDGYDYNGSALTDSNYVDIRVMYDMIQSINSATVGSDTISAYAALSRIHRASTSNNLAVGILFQPYNYIVANALEDGLISYSNDVVSDAYKNGVWQNPYSEEHLFGYVVDDVVNGPSVSFSFMNIDSLSTQAFQQIQFDPGDGGGFRTVTMGGSVNAVYNEAGNVETRLKVSVGGITFLSHAIVNVSIPSASPDSTSIYGTNYVYEDFHEVYQGKTYRARVVYDQALCFDNPLIVSEGFDPWEFRNGDTTMHSLAGFTNISHIVNAYDPWNSRTIFDGKDIFYVDWLDYGADIRANAKLLKSIINWVNTNKTSGNPNVVLGQSMGGLIARYALRDMEIQGEEHQTSIFISHDVPYLGANVSPGLMYLYRDITSLFDNEIGLFISLFSSSGAEIDALYRLGRYDSVKQMLPLYVDKYWHYDSSAFDTLQAEMNEMGFPRGDPGKPLENIAIINGGNASTGVPGRYHASDKLFYFDFLVSTGLLTEGLLRFLAKRILKISMPRYWVLERTSLRMTYNVYPYLSNSGIIAESCIVYKKKFLWRDPKTTVLHENTHYAPSSGIPFDAVACSFYDTSLLDALPEPDSGDNFWLGSYDYDAGFVDELSFIPTASAMAMPGNYYRNFYSSKPIPVIDTPFDSYILQSSATEHIDFFGGIRNWLQRIETAEIIGPRIAFPGDTFYITPAYYASSFDWSVSGDFTIGIGSSSGIVSGTGNGIVEVIATDESSNYVITKRKEILVGLPEMLLSYRAVNGTYTVNADYLYEEKGEFIDKYNLTDSLFFHWKLFKDGVAVDSVSNHSLSYSFTFADADTSSVATIEFYVSYGGHAGLVSSISIDREPPFLHNVEEVDVWQDGRVMLLTSIVNFPVNTGNKLVLKENPASGYVGRMPMSVSIPGIGSFPVEVIQYMPPIQPLAFIFVEPMYGFDIFSDPDVLSYVRSVTPGTSPLLLDVDVYGFPGNRFIQRITIPVYYFAH